MVSGVACVPPRFPSPRCSCWGHCPIRFLTMPELLPEGGPVPSQCYCSARVSAEKAGVLPQASPKAPASE